MGAPAISRPGGYVVARRVTARRVAGGHSACPAARALARSGMLAAAAVASMLALAVLAVPAASAVRRPAPVAGAPHAGARAALGPDKFRNPVLGQGQDPSVVFFDGWYYFTQTSSSATYLTIRRSRSIKSLAAADQKIVWVGGERGSPGFDWWAPELHRIDGKWYIYAAADQGSNVTHRLQVLQAAQPLGPYRYLGQLTTPGDRWSIDPSPLQLPDGQLFMLWSGWPGSGNGVQDIYIARMSKPWTIVGPRVMISTPTYPFELHNGGTGLKVNESPEPIVHGSTILVTYSASACWTPYYSLGLLSTRLGADLMRASSWKKSKTAIFSSNDAARIYGPASNGWFISPNGKQTWIVFHAVSNPAGNCGAERMVYAQPVRWTAEGTPDLGGKPLPRNTVLEVPPGDPGCCKALQRGASREGPPGSG